MYHLILNFLAGTWIFINKSLAVKAVLLEILSCLFFKLPKPWFWGFLTSTVHMPRHIRHLCKLQSFVAFSDVPSPQNSGRPAEGLRPRDISFALRGRRLCLAASTLVSWWPFKCLKTVNFARIASWTAGVRVLLVCSLRLVETTKMIRYRTWTTRITY